MNIRVRMQVNSVQKNQDGETVVLSPVNVQNAAANNPPNPPNTAPNQKPIAQDKNLATIGGNVTLTLRNTDQHGQLLQDKQYDLTLAAV